MGPGEVWLIRADKSSARGDSRSLPGLEFGQRLFLDRDLGRPTLGAMRQSTDRHGVERPKGALVKRKEGAKSKTSTDHMKP